MAVPLLVQPARRSMKPARTVASTPGGKLAQQRTESTSQLDPLIGTLVSGRYRVQELIGSGGMGRVYRATQEPLGRPIALKVVREEASPDEEDLRAENRLVVEASILAQLQHPNIVTLHDFGSVDGAFSGRMFLAMELLEGRSLKQHLDLDRRMPAARLVTIIEQVASGLRFAHRKGIVHRDLKPSNIVLMRDPDGDETVKLVDFGIGKILGPAAMTTKLTRTGAVLGTVGYISPEQMDSRVSPASDMFALGVVMFEALTGKAPLDAASAASDVDAAPKISGVAPDLELPPGLESLVAALLSRDPYARPTASETIRRLAATHATPPESTAPLTTRNVAAITNEGSAAVTFSEAQEPQAPTPKPAAKPWLAHVALALVLAYAVAATFLLSRQPPATAPAPSPRADLPLAAAASPPPQETPSPPPTTTARPQPKPRARVLPASPAPSPPAADPAPARTIFNEISTD